MTLPTIDTSATLETLYKDAFDLYTDELGPIRKSASNLGKLKESWTAHIYHLMCSTNNAVEADIAELFKEKRTLDSEFTDTTKSCERAKALNERLIEVIALIERRTVNAQGILDRSEGQPEATAEARLVTQNGPPYITTLKKCQQWIGALSAKFAVRIEDAKREKETFDGAVRNDGIVPTSLATLFKYGGILNVSFLHDDIQFNQVKNTEAKELIKKCIKLYEKAIDQLVEMTKKVGSIKENCEYSSLLLSNRQTCKHEVDKDKHNVNKRRLLKTISEIENSIHQFEPTVKYLFAAKTNLLDIKEKGFAGNMSVDESDIALVNRYFIKFFAYFDHTTRRLPKAQAALKQYEKLIEPTPGLMSKAVEYFIPTTGDE